MVAFYMDRLTGAATGTDVGMLKHVDHIEGNDSNSRLWCYRSSCLFILRCSDAIWYANETIDQMASMATVVSMAAAMIAVSVCSAVANESCSDDRLPRLRVIHKFDGIHTNQVDVEATSKGVTDIDNRSDSDAQHSPSTKLVAKGYTPAPRSRYNPISIDVAAESNANAHKKLGDATAEAVKRTQQRIAAVESFKKATTNGIGIDAAKASRTKANQALNDALKEQQAAKDIVVVHAMAFLETLRTHFARAMAKNMTNEENAIWNSIMRVQEKFATSLDEATDADSAAQQSKDTSQCPTLRGIARKAWVEESKLSLQLHQAFQKLVVYKGTKPPSGASQHDAKPTLNHQVATTHHSAKADATGVPAVLSPAPLLPLAPAPGHVDLSQVATPASPVIANGTSSARVSDAAPVALDKTQFRVDGNLIGTIDEAMTLESFYRSYKTWTTTVKKVFTRHTLVPLTEKAKRLTLFNDWYRQSIMLLDKSIKSNTIEDPGQTKIPYNLEPDDQTTQAWLVEWITDIWGQSIEQVLGWCDVIRVCKAMDPSNVRAFLHVGQEEHAGPHHGFISNFQQLYVDMHSKEIGKYGLHNASFTATLYFTKKLGTDAERAEFVQKEQSAPGGRQNEGKHLYDDWARTLITNRTYATVRQAYNEAREYAKVAAIGANVMFESVVLGEDATKDVLKFFLSTTSSYDQLLSCTMYEMLRKRPDAHSCLSAMQGILKNLKTISGDVAGQRMFCETVFRRHLTSHDDSWLEMANHVPDDRAFVLGFVGLATRIHEDIRFKSTWNQVINRSSNNLKMEMNCLFGERSRNQYGSLFDFAMFPDNMFDRKSTCMWLSNKVQDHVCSISTPNPNKLPIFTQEHV